MTDARSGGSESENSRLRTAQTEKVGPRRTCVGCRAVRAQGELVRIVKVAEGSLEVSRTLPGRGAWLCAGSLPCFDLAVRRNALPRALRTKVGSNQIEQLRNDFVPSGRAALD